VLSNLLPFIGYLFFFFLYGWLIDSSHFLMKSVQKKTEKLMAILMMMKRVELPD
jgi:hypothetical protein